MIHGIGSYRRVNRVLSLDRSGEGVAAWFPSQRNKEAKQWRIPSLEADIRKLSFISNQMEGPPPERFEWIRGSERQTHVGKQRRGQWPDEGHDRCDGAFGDFKNVEGAGPPRVIVSHASCVNSDRASPVGPEHARAESAVALPCLGEERSNSTAAAEPCAPRGACGASVRAQQRHKRIEVASLVRSPNSAYLRSSA